MTYAEAIRFLYDLRWFGAKLGLENTLKLAELAGNPQSRLRFIHVAGTNGKGSTCAMLESIYRAAGLRVGLFTLPHLVSFRERIQVNRQWIGEADVVRLVGELGVQCSEFRLQAAPEPAKAGTPNPDASPTFFEVVTVMALRYFAEQKCDLVIWETGLGGRLDATNIVTPLASVITNVQHDHEKWLGSTITQIATEKAGIIKPGVPVITTAAEPEALAVIQATARHLKAPLTCVEPLHASRFTAHVSLPLLGEHQQLNAALAVATVEALQDPIPVNDDVIRAGLSTVQWPGRLQIVPRAGGQKILLDGAHNVAGIEALGTALHQYFSGTDATLILGVLADKDWQHICQLLAPLAARILTVPVSSERTTSAQELAEACRAANPRAAVTDCPSLAAALAESGKDGFVVVTGSLYLVGEAMELLGLCPEAGKSERELNEWGATDSAMHGKARTA